MSKTIEQAVEDIRKLLSNYKYSYPENGQIVNKFFELFNNQDVNGNNNNQNINYSVGTTFILYLCLITKGESFPLFVNPIADIIKDIDITKTIPDFCENLVLIFQNLFEEMSQTNGVFKIIQKILLCAIDNKIYNVISYLFSLNFFCFNNSLEFSTDNTMTFKDVIDSLPSIFNNKQFLHEVYIEILNILIKKQNQVDIEKLLPSLLQNLDSNNVSNTLLSVAEANNLYIFKTVLAKYNELKNKPEQSFLQELYNKTSSEEIKQHMKDTFKNLATSFEQVEQPFSLTVKSTPTIINNCDGSQTTYILSYDVAKKTTIMKKQRSNIPDNRNVEDPICCDTNKQNRSAIVYNTDITPTDITPTDITPTDITPKENTITIISYGSTNESIVQKFVGKKLYTLIENGKTLIENGQTLIENGQTLIENGQTLIENGQTLIENGQTLIENGQTLIENGQTLIENGQRTDKLHNTVAGFGLGCILGCVVFAGCFVAAKLTTIATFATIVGLGTTFSVFLPLVGLALLCGIVGGIFGYKYNNTLNNNAYKPIIDMSIDKKSNILNAPLPNDSTEKTTNTNKNSFFARSNDESIEEDSTTSKTPHDFAEHTDIITPQKS